MRLPITCELSTSKKYQASPSQNKKLVYDSFKYLYVLCFVSCVSHAFVSVHSYLVVTCWERADLLALVGDVYCIFVTFQ